MMIAQPTRGRNGVAARRTSQQQLLERRAGGGLQASPFVHRHQYDSLRAAPGHHLRAFLQAGIEELTEARFGILHGPNIQGFVHG